MFRLFKNPLFVFVLIMALLSACSSGGSVPAPKPTDSPVQRSEPAPTAVRIPTPHPEPPMFVVSLPADIVVDENGEIVDIVIIGAMAMVPFVPGGSANIGNCEAQTGLILDHMFEEGGARLARVGGIEGARKLFAAWATRSFSIIKGATRGVTQVGLAITLADGTRYFISGGNTPKPTIIPMVVGAAGQAITSLLSSYDRILQNPVSLKYVDELARVGECALKELEKRTAELENSSYRPQQIVFVPLPVPTPVGVPQLDYGQISSQLGNVPGWFLVYFEEWTLSLTSEDILILFAIGVVVVIAVACSATVACIPVLATAGSGGAAAWVQAAPRYAVP